jgi:unsaturated chondroitin disaccharide hydrolase
VKLETALTGLVRRVSETADQVGDRFPVFAEPARGRWMTSTRGSWTAGFWVGLLWLRAYRTGSTDHVEAARHWCARLAPRLDDDTVTRAMTFWYGAVLGQRLLGDHTGHHLGLLAADRLVGSWLPDIGVIPLGTAFGSASGNRRTSIDCVGPTVALLAWAQAQQGSGPFLGIARRHLDRHVDMSVLENGAVVCRLSLRAGGTTWEPERVAPCDVDGTGWSRGHAWALLALAEAVRIDDTFTPQARRVADCWASRVPAGTLPAWHFGDPNGVRDSSAAVIAAVGLLGLHHRLRDDSSYRAHAQDLVDAALRALTPTAPTDSRPVGMLLDGCYDHSRMIAVRHELIWGDFFLFLALTMMTDRHLCQ